MLMFIFLLVVFREISFCLISLAISFEGLSFIFGKSGGVDIWKTCIKSNIRKLVKEINSLPVEDYDLVINDFEPVSAWACYAKNVPCIGLSHQSAVLAEEAPENRRYRCSWQTYPQKLCAQY
jgi:uncharacterized protein (TIGR00661 family)